jgi:hypothetical protein
MSLDFLALDVQSNHRASLRGLQKFQPPSDQLSSFAHRH